MIFKKQTLFEKDFALISSLYPKLRFSWNEKSKQWHVSGELDICDSTGLYWGTFDILIILESPYPVEVPLVFEISHIIPRIESWHISELGECCVDIPHNLKLVFQRGMRLPCFMKEKVYPYFANQLHRLTHHSYAGQEYGHRFEGVIQYYKDELNLDNPTLAMTFIKIILEKKIPGRNSTCLCNGGKKTKNCHLSSIETLKDLGEDILRKDLLDFEQWEFDKKELIL